MIESLERRVLFDGGSAAGGLPARAVGPDLTVAWVKHLRGQVIAGKTLPANLAVRNQAAATAVAPPSVVALYASIDAAQDAADRLLASAPVTRALRPGKAFRVRLDVEFPPDLAAGTYHLLARVDDANAVAEGDETNNVADAGTVYVAAPFVDIVPVKVTRVILRSWRGIDFNGAITFAIRNEGNVAFDGDVNGTTRIDGAGDAWTTSFSRPVFVKPGATVKIGVSVDGAWVVPEYVFTLTPRAPGDPTPDESIWVRAKLVYFTWAGRPLNRGGIISQGVGAQPAS